MILTISYSGTKMCLQTVRSYTKAIKYGSKYIYQTVPRLLTLWLDLGEDEKIYGSDTYVKINQEVKRVCDSVPAYKVRPLYSSRPVTRYS